MKRTSKTKKIHLTRRERLALREILRRGHTGIWLASRAQAVLLAASGESVSAIAQTVARDRKWVRCWIDRFERFRLEGLEDKPRSGRPPKFSPRGAA